MDNKSSTSGGVGFSGLLTIAFIVLKLCGVINWSWWWVLSPMWISVAIMLLIGCIMGVFYLAKAIDDKKRIAAGMNEWAWKRRKKKPSQKITEPPLSQWEERLKQMKENKR